MLSAMIEELNSCGHVWTVWMGVSILDATIVLALAAILWFAVRKRASAQLGYCLFLLVLLKLIVPLPVAVPGRLARWTPAHVLSAAWAPREASRQDQPVATPASHREPVAVEGGPRGGTWAPRTTPAGQRHVSPPARDSDELLAASEGPVEETVVERGSGEAGPAVAAAATADGSGERGAYPSFFGWIMIAWAIGVCALAIRALCVQVRFHRRLRGAKPVAFSGLPVDFHELCGRIGLKRRVRLVESDVTASPAVWGIRRPVLILPEGMIRSLTGRQLEWILLHELTHVRRHDVAVACFQRLLAILHFVNPAVWIANRAINRLREYACDDAAAALCGGSRIESSEAFLRVVRYAAESRSRLGTQLDGAIGVFDSTARASCFRRMTRLLDTDRRLRLRLGLGSLCVLLLAALVALPQIRAASDPPNAEEPLAQQPAEESDGADLPATAVAHESAHSTSAARRFTLTVVGPDGQAIPNASVEVRMRPKPEKWTVHSGTLVRIGSYATFMTAGPDGRLALDLPDREPGYLAFSIETKGYAPFWAEWDSSEHAEPIPALYTARLDAGKSVGGIVVDEEGKPIDGVEIHPGIQFKKRRGDLSSLWVGTRLKTDVQGKWSYDCVPASMADLGLEIMHPRYMPVWISIPTKEFSLQEGEEPTAKTVLERGITVTGMVTDEAGLAIAGAVVRTTFMNDQREATTGEDGIYRLIGCKSVRTDLVVTARGRAPELKNVKIEPAMPPVDFKLQPGRTIRVRVTDADGNPIARTRIFFQSWRGDSHDYELGTIHQYTDESGVWEWNEAPADPVICDICPPGGMALGRQSLVARDEEYVFTPPPPLVISGRVVDIETKRPIKTFRVVPGVRFNERDMIWNRTDAFDGSDGRYRIRHVHPRSAHLIRIEADGYSPAVSRDIKSDEGSVTIDFELARGKSVEALVLSPDGSPARGAKVAMGVPGAQISIRNGDIMDISTYCDRSVTDDNGRFSFPPQGTPFQLIVTHPAGYARVKAEPRDPPETIRLESWARVEGMLRVGTRTAAGKQITLDIEGESYGEDVPNVSFVYEATTDENGQFTFDRVVPAKGRIGQRVVFRVRQHFYAATSSHTQPIDLPSGETVQLDLGGTGRPVVGRLMPPEGIDAEIDWKFSIVEITTKLAAPPPAPIPEDIKDDAEKTKSWWADWAATDEGKAWQEQWDEYYALQAASARFAATIGQDGTFRVDDVPAGEYELTVRLEGVPEDGYSSGPLLGILTHTFTVPEMEGDRSDEPLDLGTLTLEQVPSPDAAAGR